MSELLQIPHYAVDNLVARAEAQSNFAQLGRTLPMVSIHFEDVGPLALPIDDSRLEGKNHFEISPDEHLALLGLASQAFQYFTGEQATQLHFSQMFEPFTFVPDGTIPYAWRTQSREQRVKHSQLYTKYDGGPHNDTSYEGNSPIVYGVHFTPVGNGVVEAGTPVGVPVEPDNNLRFPRGTATHAREFGAGDMHIFVRQAPPRHLYDASQGIISPTTHEFFTTDDTGRLRIEASFGRSSEWAA